MRPGARSGRFPEVTAPACCHRALRPHSRPRAGRIPQKLRPRAAPPQYHAPFHRKAAATPRTVVPPARRWAPGPRMQPTARLEDLAAAEGLRPSSPGRITFTGVSAVTSGSAGPFQPLRSAQPSFLAFSRGIPRCHTLARLEAPSVDHLFWRFPGVFQGGHSSGTPSLRQQAGNGATRAMRWPLTGWVNVRRRACNAIPAANGCRLPYLKSPTIG